MSEPQQNQNVIGNTVTIRFASLNNASSEGKVDTGATTSSLHATNIKIHPDGSRVSFNSEPLSPNVITMNLDGSQTVHSADNGGDKRPTIRLDIEVNGVQIQGAEFNLNDRSKMDTHILVGQNVLKAGNFVIDVNKEEDPAEIGAQTDTPRLPESVDKEEKILDAIRILAEADITLGDLLKYIKTQAVISIRE
jgi:hypothetical protein